MNDSVKFRYGKNFIDNTITQFEELIQTNEEIKTLMEVAQKKGLHNLMWEFDTAPNELQNI